MKSAANLHSMIKPLVFLLVLLLSTSTIAQFTVKVVSDTNGGADPFAFPVLQSVGEPEAAKKINNTLQMAELGSPLDPNSKNPLAKLMNEDEYGYSIICNNERVFSLEVSTGHNGAGSHFQFRNYSFDAKTGDGIDLNKLFFPDAQVKVRRAVYKAWKETIKTNLSGLSLFVGSPGVANTLERALIKGKIDGKYPFTMTLQKADASVQGVIVYDKVNIPIKLTGTLAGNKIAFNEMGDSNNALSQIDCTWDGKNLSGTFKNLKTGKVMSFAGARL
jgi:hypothetical protein